MINCTSVLLRDTVISSITILPCTSPISVRAFFNDDFRPVDDVFTQSTTVTLSATDIRTLTLAQIDGGIHLGVSIVFWLLVLVTYVVIKLGISYLKFVAGSSDVDCIKYME